MGEASCYPPSPRAAAAGGDGAASGGGRDAIHLSQAGAARLRGLGGGGSAPGATAVVSPVSASISATSPLPTSIPFWFVFASPAPPLWILRCFPIHENLVVLLVSVAIGRLGFQSLTVLLVG